MCCDDYPRGFVNCSWLWWIPASHPLPVSSALTVPLLLARRRLPVSLLGFKARPFSCRFPAPLAAITLTRLPRMEALVAAFEQTPPHPRPTCPALVPTSRLIFARVCNSLGRAHGR